MREMTTIVLVIISIIMVCDTVMAEEYAPYRMVSVDGEMMVCSPPEAMVVITEALEKCQVRLKVEVRKEKLICDARVAEMTKVKAIELEAERRKIEVLMGEVERDSGGVDMWTWMGPLLGITCILGAVGTIYLMR